MSYFIFTRVSFINISMVTYGIDANWFIEKVILQF